MADDVMPGTTYTIKEGDRYMDVPPGTVLVPAPGKILVDWHDRPTTTRGGVQLPDDARIQKPVKATVLAYGPWSLAKHGYAPPPVGSRVQWSTGTQVGAGQDGPIELTYIEAKDIIAYLTEPAFAAAASAAGFPDDVDEVVA